MAQTKFLKTQHLADWLADLGRERKILVPVEEGGRVVFRPNAEAVKPVLSQNAVAPPKGAVLPACQELFCFERTKSPEDPHNPVLELHATVEAEPALVFGTRPCDARGFTILDRVYEGLRFPDPYYRSARENTLIVTLTCGRAENTCFCNWVGGGPDDSTGSDVLATEMEGGFYLEAVSRRGEALLENGLLCSAEGKAGEKNALRDRARRDLSPAPDIAGAPESIIAIFDDPHFWEAVSAKCLSCGACTYLCPTCYCFTITDEDFGNSGRRLRSWDNCMSYQFSLEASGHNPRATKALRLRNRLGHKFSYFPQLYGGIFACCGCGRCIKSCPACVDIREIVLDSIARAKEASHERYGCR